jgi:GAF domain-containing protein
MTMRDFLHEMELHRISPTAAVQALAEAFRERDEDEPSGDLGDGSPPASLQAILDRHESYRALGATLDVLHKSASAARDHAIERLDDLVARIRTKFWAYAVWLYVKEGEELRTIVTQNTLGLDAVISLREESIVSWVAKAEDGEGYLTNNTDKDPHYKRTLPETRSAMAVPLITPEGERIAVLHLESLQRGAFSQGLLRDLQTAATQLIPHLLVLRSLDEFGPQWCPWHPGVYKRWDLVDLLGQVCFAIRKALPGDDAIQCAIWLVDRPHSQIYVYATTGHAEEFITDEVLGLDASFTGAVAGCPAGSVGVVSPEEDHSHLYVPTAAGIVEREGHPFVTDFRGRFTNLRRAIAAPIHRVDSAGEAGEAWCVLGIYAEDERAVAALPSHEEMTRLADLLGEVISAYIDQRERLARAYLRSRIARRDPAADPGPIFVGSNHLLPLIDMEIVVLRPGREPIEISWGGWQQGLNSPMAHRPRPGDDPWSRWPRLSTLPRAYLSYLIEHPERPVRTNNAGSWRPPGIAIEPGESFGRLPWNDPERRRFLDVAVIAEDGEPLGLVRLIRSAGDKPFLPSDAQVIRSLTRECAEVLQSWRLQEEQVSVPAPVLSSDDDGEGLRGEINGFWSPVPILRCLVDYFQPYGPVHVGFAIKRPIAGAPFRWYPFRSPSRYWVNSGNPERMAYMPGMDWEQLVKNRRPITFNLAREEGREVMSGIRVPLLAWSEDSLLAWPMGRGLLEGVLSLDFRRPIDWNPSHVGLLCHAAQRIAEIVAPRFPGPPPPAPRPGPGGPDISMLERMRNYLERQFDSLRVDVLLRYGDDYRPILNLTSDPGLSEAGWEPVRDDLDYEAATYGVEQGKAAGRLALQVPVYLGPCRAGFVRCDLGERLAPVDARDQDQRRIVKARHQVIDAISGFWSQSIGTQATSNLQFSEDRSERNEGELIVWDQTVVWPSSVG